MIAGFAARAAGLARDVVDLALPQRCPGCAAAGDPRHLLCRACLERIPRLSTVLCARCLAAGATPAGCRRHPGFEVSAPWIYDERVARLVHAFKYQERPGLAGTLGETMARALDPDLRVDLVLDVPLHPARQRERGYNQAARLADVVARVIAAPRLARGLERVRPTPPQARLGPAERRANLAGAVRLEQPHALAGRTVLIVDDVLTTGATLEACLEPLRRAGSRASALALAWAQ